MRAAAQAMRPGAAAARGIRLALVVSASALAGCVTLPDLPLPPRPANVAPPPRSTAPTPPRRPAGWSAPEVLVGPAAFSGDYGLAIATSDLRAPTGDRRAVPAGMKFDDGALWVADVFGFRRVDVATGAVSDVLRMQRDPDLNYPFAVGLSATHFALTSWFTGTVQLVERKTLRTTALLRGLKTPEDAVPMADGSVIYAELGSGSITRATGPKLERKEVLASGLGGPVQLLVGRDGALYLTESAGRLTRLPLDASAPLRVIADDLAQPEGLAQTPWGSIVVAEANARRLVEIDPTSGARRVVAANLPIGLRGAAGMPAPYVPTGVAVGSDGTIYLSADRDNAILRIRPAP